MVWRYPCGLSTRQGIVCSVDSWQSQIVFNFCSCPAYWPLCTICTFITFVNNSLMSDLIFKIQKPPTNTYIFLDKLNSFMSSTLLSITFERLGWLSKFKNCLKDIDSSHILVYFNKVCVDDARPQGETPKISSKIMKKEGTEKGIRKREKKGGKSLFLYSRQQKGEGLKTTNIYIYVYCISPSLGGKNDSR